MNGLRKYRQFKYRDSVHDMEDWDIEAELSGRDDIGFLEGSPSQRCKVLHLQSSVSEMTLLRSFRTVTHLEKPGKYDSPASASSSYTLSLRTYIACILSASARMTPAALTLMGKITSLPIITCCTFQNAVKG